MTRSQRAVRQSWVATIRAAIRLGEDEAAYRLTIGYLRRLREVGVVLWRN